VGFVVDAPASLFFLVLVFFSLIWDGFCMRLGFPHGRETVVFFILLLDGCLFFFLRLFFFFPSFRVARVLFFSVLSVFGELARGFFLGVVGGH